MAALGLAAAIVYVLELLNNSFTNPDEIESDLRLPVLGILPAVGEGEIEAALVDPKSGLSEAYRSLRTSLQFSGTEGAPRSLLVTSAVSSEGKSTSAMKLAQDFGAVGTRVLLIDADMRRPSLHRLFGTGNALGLSNLLTNSVRRDDLPKIMQRTGFPNVTLMTAGTPPPNPADLLTSQKMALIIRALTDKYDMVILDSAPVLGLSDALILSRLVDGTLMAVSAHQVTRKSAKAALKRLRLAGGHVVGAAFTKFSVDRFEYKYAYRYMNYEYYGYGETPKTLGVANSNSEQQAETSLPEWYDRGLVFLRDISRRYFKRKPS